MPIITLYRYKWDDGGIAVSPEKPKNPDKPYTTKYRLVADEGKVFVKGNAVTTCLDVDSSEGWDEIDAPEDAEKRVI